ncbi:MAG: hypothetical protein ACYC4U_27390 [Pirellulaceae bacterium]
MIDPKDDLHATDKSGRRTSWRRVILGALVMLLGLGLAVFAYLWFGVPPRVPMSPVHWVRTGQGPLEPAKPEEEPGGVRFEVQAGKTESSSTFSSSAVCSEPEGAGFACARIVIFNRSEHLLMARIGGRLLDQLKPVAFLRQVDYYPAGSHMEEGQLEPDLVVTLDLEKLTENRGLTTSTVEATISVRAGNGEPDCRNHHFDALSPPVVQLDWCGRLEHRSATTGVASSAARYQQVADDIAKQIATKLTNELSDRRKKNTSLPELPADFYPAYRKPVALPLHALGEAELVWAWHGLLNHSDVLWRISTDRRPADLIAQLQNILEESGWQPGDMSGDADSPFLRICQKDIVLQAYSAPAINSKQNDAPSRRLVYIHYLDRMAHSEVEAAVGRAIDRGDSAEVLMVFQRQWSSAQQPKILEKLQASPAQTPQAAMQLADLYHRLQQDTESKRELLRAQILLRTVGAPGQLEKRLKTLANELGDEQLAERPIDAQRLVDVGFQELEPGRPVVPQDVNIDQPVLFFVKQSPSNEELRTIALRVIKTGTTEPLAIGLAHVDVSQNNRSWGTSGAGLVCEIGNAASLRFQVQPVESQERFRLTAEWVMPPK